VIWLAIARFEMEGDIGEPHWVALSLIDMSEDYQCHSPAHIIVVIHPPRK
jgi:hypothetical protein